MKHLNKTRALWMASLVLAGLMAVAGTALLRATVTWHRTDGAEKLGPTTTGLTTQGGRDGTDCLCQQGTWRYCERNFGDWGIQRCQPDGQAWGPCQESEEPHEGCFAGALWFETRSLLCCKTSNTECCQDYHDSDDDGDRHDSVGACENIVCNYVRPAEDKAAQVRRYAAVRS